MLNRLKLAAATVVTAAAVMVAPAPAMAAVYDGVMASATPCATGAYTARQKTLTTNTQLSEVIAKIELRYSPSCRTVWARITSIKVTSDNLLGYVRRNSDWQGYECSEFGYSKNLGAQYCLTPMVNDAGVTSYALGGLKYNGVNYDGETASF
ncbi:DUF2690 domain-containing protein [Actinoplanes sp. NPDC023801]|uniref:DUF2690 domain-containing protein n=1 Tax=Actinoplanes sp. NPDC023801 TaxID=3154595 RepID=UPI0033C3F3BB